MALDPLTAGFEFGKSALGVLDQLVDDGDLKAKLAYQLALKQSDFLRNIYTSEAVPGYVKFLHALRDLIIPLLRPTVGAMLTGYAAYTASQGIAIPEWLQAMTGAAFPGWMVMRGMDKRRETIANVEMERNKELARPGAVPQRTGDDNVYDIG